MGYLCNLIVAAGKVAHAIRVTFTMSIKISLELKLQLYFIKYEIPLGNIWFKIQNC